MHVATSRGRLEIVQLLIEAGADVDHVNDQNEYLLSPYTALSLASRNGHLDVVQSLFYAKASIAESSLIPNSLDAACKHRQYAFMDILLDELALTNTDGSVYNDALSTALKDCDEKSLRMLMDYCVTQDPKMLHQACAAGFEAGVKTLIDAGADVLTEDYQGGQALHVAQVNITQHSYGSIFDPALMSTRKLHIMEAPWWQLSKDL